MHEELKDDPGWQRQVKIGFCKRGSPTVQASMGRRQVRLLLVPPARFESLPTLSRHAVFSIWFLGAAVERR